MLDTAVPFLIEILASLLAGACLLRAYVNHQGIGLTGPLGRFIAALTDWAVLPLRRVLPKPGRWDLASLLLAVLTKGLQFAIITVWIRASLTAWPMLTLLGLLQLTASLITVVMVVHALASWVRLDPALHDWLRRLCEPLLAPVRRVLPPIGGVDLSSMIWVIAMQLLARSLGHWQSQWLMPAMG